MANSDLTLDQVILDVFKNFNTGEVLEFCTEFRYEDKIYRAHPNYRKGGLWFDFVNVEYNVENIDFENND